MYVPSVHALISTGSQPAPAPQACAMQANDSDGRAAAAARRAASSSADMAGQSFGCTSSTTARLQYGVGCVRALTVLCLRHGNGARRSPRARAMECEHLAACCAAAYASESARTVVAPSPARVTRSAKHALRCSTRVAPQCARPRCAPRAAWRTRAARLCPA